MVTREARQWWRVGFFGALAACNVSAARPTTAVHIDGGASADGGVFSACPAAMLVASSDFVSTNISVLSPSGALLSETILSSGSATPGLTAALSGDVIFPLARTPGEIVLIDQFPNAVLTWVDPSSAKVLRQMNVGTGFSANPHDYLELSAAKAYVTRYGSNMNAGQEADDGGGDVLIINPQTAAISGRIAFATDGAFLPSPDHMLHVGSDVWVTLDRFDAGGMTAGDARLAGVSTSDDTIAWTVDLAGAANCAGVAMAPSGRVVALSCTGVSGDPTPRSAVVLLDATARPPTEIKRFDVATQLSLPLGYTLAFATETLLVGVTLGDQMAGRNDFAYTLDLGSGTAQVLADAGAAVAFGDVRCAPGCGDLCFLADAHANALRVWKANGSSLDAQTSVSVDPNVGLPPRSLGAF